MYLTGGYQIISGPVTISLMQYYSSFVPIWWFKDPIVLIILMHAKNYRLIPHFITYKQETVDLM